MRILSKTSQVGISVYGMPEDEETKSKDPNEFMFNLSKWQGDSENGRKGYQEMLGTKEVIMKLSKEMQAKYPDFYNEAKSAYLQSKDTLKKTGGLSNDKDLDYDRDAYVKVTATSILNGKTSDGVEIYSLNSIDKSEPEDLTIKVSKWQGDCEKGLEGLIRMMLLQDCIEEVDELLKSDFPQIRATEVPESQLTM